MSWSSIWKDFANQFATQGPQQYADISNPDMRRELSQQRQAKMVQGMDVASGVTAHNVAEDKAAASAASKPDAYKREYNKNGGYTFTDGSGKPISAFEFATAKGIPVTQALQGSYDPGDIQFLQDTQAMMQDMTTVNPRTGKPVTSYQDGLNRLMKDYPTIFLGQGGNTNTFNQERTASRAAAFAPDVVPAAGNGQGANSGGSFWVFGNAQKELEKQQFINDLVPTITKAANGTQAAALAQQIAKKHGIDLNTKYKAGTKEKDWADTAIGAVNNIFAQPNITQSNNPYPF